VTIPFAEADTHFLIVGRTGSGKTLTIYSLLREVLPRLATSPDWRMAIFDPKTDTRSRLRALGHKGEVVILHPFDRRCAPWDMAKDLTAPEEVHHAARLFFPTEKESRQPFFSNAAADLLEGVILSFNKKRPGDWTFRDVICAMESEDLLRAVLSWNEEENASRLALYFKKDGINQDVLGEIGTKLGYYRVVAAYWSQAQNKKYSLEQWATSNDVLLIGNSHRGGKAIEGINRVLFYRLSQVLLDQQNSAARRSWIVLDELPAAGNLDGLDQLLLKGRSKGVCLVLGFQDIAALEHIYGEKQAEVITGQATHRAVFALNSPKTAKWAEEAFFDREEPVWLKSSSRTEGSGGASTTEGGGEQLLRRPLFLSSEFAMLHPPNRKHGLGLQGVFRTGRNPAEKYVVHLEHLAQLPDTSKSGPPPSQGEDDPEADFLLADPESGHLKGWSDQEKNAWGLERSTARPTEEPPHLGQVASGLLSLKYR